MSQHSTTSWPIPVWAILVGLISTTLSAADVQGPPLANTKPLKITEPLDKVMIAGLDRFCLRELAASVKNRQSKWNRDYSSVEAYNKSVAKNRESLRTKIGAVDQRVQASDIELVTTLSKSSVLADTDNFTAHYVRWNVLDGVTGEGILFQPKAEVKARVVVIPDMLEVKLDYAPEIRTDFAIKLATNGIQVLSMASISVSPEFSGNKYVAFTNQPHREYVYRMAFEMGRHVIGYEVQKVLAAVDIFEKHNQKTKRDLPIGVAGAGEGALLAFYAAALDTRIDSALVSGYFQQREALWEEPIYRNVWGLLSEFGDADIASLIAPRSLFIENGLTESANFPLETKPGRRGGAAPGKIGPIKKESVEAEFAKAKVHWERLGSNKIALHHGDKRSTFMGIGSVDEAVAGNAFIEELTGVKETKPVTKKIGHYVSEHSHSRQERQVKELTVFTQSLLRVSSKVRDKRWSKASASSPEAWAKTADEYRDMVYEEMIGRLPHKRIAPNVRTRQIIDEPEYRGYEVVLDVFQDVIATGILCLPKDIKSGEKRPVVVCQHGLEGVPMDTITRTGNGFRYYSAFAHDLAKLGFITYAPQNPYRGRDEFRTLQRKSNPLARSLFSYIIPQHEQTLDWLSTLPEVDANRIAFYGLSYGGKTAVRVPPMVKKYCLSICSADYNEWVVKNTTDEHRYSYLFTGEYEIFEWNMGHVANYAELSKLMTPRPFMVERGHNDGVAPDEWVAWEYSKVRRHYVQMGLGDKTEIEFFNGPHKINSQGTFRFLKKHLDWNQAQ